MTLGELKQMLKGIPNDIEVIFSVTDQNGMNEESAGLDRVEWLRFVPGFADCNLVEFVVSVDRSNQEESQ